MTQQIDEVHVGRSVRMMRLRLRAGVINTAIMAALFGFGALGYASDVRGETTSQGAGVPSAAMDRPIDDSLSGLFNPDGTLAGADGMVQRNTKSKVPPPSDPSKQQLAAYGVLTKEAKTYQAGARDYRDTITGIVKQHYEERKRRVLSSLDRDIAIERKGLQQARGRAIQRLQAFIDNYSGPNAVPEVTPNAMFRLAALYDEKARASFDQDLGVGLKPAIVLYKRIIREFPTYKETAGVYYYLGHALFDSERLDEAQQVWRSMVCHNLYPYPVAADPKDPERDAIGAVPQDHDEDYWTGWRHEFPTPESLPQEAQNKHGARKARRKTKRRNEFELTYLNPFPSSCQPIPQKVPKGSDPRYLAEIWWKIGDWYFDETDPKAGPFSFNRAVTAYKKSMDASSQEKDVLYGVSMYKLAWTYYKQQRYRAAVHQFVDLLRYTDEVQKRTGDPGADFRSEAYTYIAGSLTYVDFEGPGADEPYIPRSDVLDLEQNPTIVEQKMHVAIDRVQNSSLIPQDAPWTFNIYKGLAMEFKDLGQMHNRIEVSELMLKKWPMHPSAPEIQAGIADTYDELARMSREGTAEHAASAEKALAARSKLAAYVGNTAWVNANRDNPEALQRAELLVRGGLQRAAAEHTNRARAFLQRADQIGDVEERRAELGRALQEFQLAEKAWAGYLAQDENASDAYESRFWLADARHWVVHCKVAMGETPTVGDVLNARRAAVAVRDSNEDDRWLEVAAYYAVDIAFLVRDDRVHVYEQSNGASGLQVRSEVEFEGEGKARKVAKSPLPPAVRFLNLSQEEYMETVPESLDVNKRADKFAFQIAESYFFYGQFAEARKRYEPIYAKACGKSDFGYKAWERLLTMSNLEGDVEQSRKLAEAEKKRSCAVSEEQKTGEALLINPTLQEAAYRDARKAFEKAEKMKDGPERDAMWRKAAALYRSALENAPDRDEAPEAAMNGALAYKHVGEYDKAIGMYELFIGRYGDEKTLAKLENGDPKAKPPLAASPEKYAERVKYLKAAHGALSSAYVLFFNYRKAAEEYDKISQISRFTQKDRRDAAKNALTLYSNMGDRGKTEAVRKRFIGLGASPEEKAEADFIQARSEMNEWDEHGQDAGANKAARLKAMGAMSRYYAGHRNKPEAGRWVVQAAYNVAKMRRIGGDGLYTSWYKKTIKAFGAYKTHAPRKAGKSSALGTVEAGMAAEADYRLLDQELKKKFDYDTGHHRYKGTVVDVIKAYRADAADAERYHKKLQNVIDAYLSPEWAVAARARQGSLYDSLRTGLYNAREPALKLFTDKEEKILRKLEESDNPVHQDKADAYRQNRMTTWRNTRDKELESADHIMVRRYVEAVAMARRYNITNPAVDRAVARLAFFTEILGDEKLRRYCDGVKDFTYEDRMFLRSRAGITERPKVKLVPVPLPVVPQ